MLILAALSLLLAQAFLGQHVTNLLKTSFTNVAPAAVEKFVGGCFQVPAAVDVGTQQAALAGFKTHVRDFLIQLKEFSAEDNKDLYSEEAAAAAAAQAEAAKQRGLQVPGLVNPHLLEDDDL